MEKEKSNPHKNHRQRLRNKVSNYGLACLEYHEVLELLLTYTIARKDTNPIGHNLLEHFGSFKNVIDASYNDLLKVDGVGPESAFFITALSQFIDVYNKSQMEQKSCILNSTTKSVQFFRDFYSIKETEFMIVVCLSKKKKVMKTFRYKGINDTEINFDLKQISNGINNDGVGSVILFHTHPSGDVSPSLADVQATQRILNMCLSQGVDFDDHIILNESQHYSFKNAGLVEKLKAKYERESDVNNIYLEALKQINPECIDEKITIDEDE